MGMSINGGGSPVQQFPTQTAVDASQGGGPPGKVDAGGAPGKTFGGGDAAVAGASGGGAIPGATGATDAAQGATLTAEQQQQLVAALTALVDVLNQLVAALQQNGTLSGGGPTQKGATLAGGATTMTTTAPVGTPPAVAAPAAATTPAAGAQPAAPATDGHAHTH